MQKEYVGAGVVRTWYLPAGCLEHHTAIVSLCLSCTATHMSCSTSRLKSSTLWLSAKVMTVWISMVNNVLALVICMYKLLIGCWTYKSIGSQCTTVGCRSSFWAVVCVSWHCSLALQRTSSLVAVLIKAFFWETIANADEPDKNQHLFRGPFSRTVCVCWYQKDKTILDFNEARSGGVLWWQWHQLYCIEWICTSFQIDDMPTPHHLSFVGQMFFLALNQPCESNADELSKCP